jgi:nicotinamidase/pyrazinamidase
MSSPSESLVFFDVDTQVDFMRPEGKLYVPGAEQIGPNLRRLMDFAHACHVPVISTADAHSPDDPEFAKWPAHCIAGTPGQQLIPETRWTSPVVIPSNGGSFRPPAHWDGQFILEKTTYSPEDNSHFDDLLRALGPRRAVVFGVVTEYCVLATARALRRRGFDVDLVTDAIKSLSQEDGRKAIEELTASGVRLVTTAQVCQPFTAATARVG